MITTTPQETLIARLKSLADPNVPLDRLAVEDAAYIELLMERIRQEGQQEPIVVLQRKDGTKIIWDGHHRLIALEKLGRQTALAVLKVE